MRGVIVGEPKDPGESSKFNMDFLSGLESNCTNITHVTLHQMEMIALVRGTTGLVCFALCAATFAFELVYIIHVRKCSLLQRLFLYLTVSTMVFMGALSLSIEHYFRYKHQERVCIFLGLFQQYTGSVQLLFILGITLFLFCKLCCFCSSCNIPTRRSRYCLEIIFCLVSVMLPWLFIWVPFLQSDGMYGASGPWCWIESRDPVTCKEIVRGVLEQLLLWYIPFGLVSILSLVCIVCLLSFFCYLKFSRGILVQQLHTVIKEMVLLLVFLGVFCVVSIVESVTYGMLGLPHVDVLVLWIINAIITPVGGVAVPIGFFSYLVVTKCFISSRPGHTKIVTVHTDTNLQTGKTGNRLLHNPSRVSQPSHTSDRDSRVFLTQSDEETNSLN